NAVAAGERPRCKSRLRAGGDVGLEVLPGDAAVRSGPRHELQFDAEIPGAPPHRRRGQRLLSQAARCGSVANTLTQLGLGGLATLSPNGRWGAGEGSNRRLAITS